MKENEGGSNSGRIIFLPNNDEIPSLFAVDGLAFVLAKRTPGVASVTIKPFLPAKCMDDHICLHKKDKGEWKIVVCHGSSICLEQYLIVLVQNHDSQSPKNIQDDLLARLRDNRYLKDRGLPFIDNCPVHQVNSTKAVVVKERIIKPTIRYSKKFPDQKFLERELIPLYPLLLKLAGQETGNPVLKIKDYGPKLLKLQQEGHIIEWVLELLKLIEMGIVERVGKKTILLHRVRIKSNSSTEEVNRMSEQDVTVITSPKFPHLYYFSSKRELECYQATLEVIENQRAGDDWTTIHTIGLFSDLQALARKKGLKPDYYMPGFTSLRKDGILEDLGHEGKARKTLIHRLNYSMEIRPRQRVYRRHQATPDPTPAPPTSPSSEIDTALAGLRGHGELLERLADQVLTTIGATRVTFERLGDSIKIDYTRC